MAKKKTVKVKIAVSDAMGPTPERVRQFGDRPARFKTDTGRVIERLSVVDSLYEADEISPEGYLSATMYAADYDVGFNSRMTANLSNDVVDGGGSADNLNAKRMDAAKRFTAASQSIPPESRHALRHMVLGEYSMTAYAVEFMGANPKSKSCSQKSKARLIRAINRLAKHYSPSASPAKPRTRASMADGARPTIHPYQQDDAA